MYNSSSKCDDHDFGDSESLSDGRVCIEMEESYTREEGSSDQLEEVNTAESANCEQLSAQLVKSANQCTKSNDSDDQSTDKFEAEKEKQKPGDTVHSASIDSSVQSNTDLADHDLILTLKEASPEVQIDNEGSLDSPQDSTHSLISGEHQSLHQVGSTEQSVFASSKCDGSDLGDEGAPLEVKESIHSSKSSGSEGQSASELHNDSTTKCEQLSPQCDTGSGTQCSDSEIGVEKSLEGAATLEASHSIPDSSLVELPLPGWKIFLKRSTVQE